MGYYLRSIREEYDDDGNYIGNSDDGNRFHGVERVPERQRRLICSRCGSGQRCSVLGGGEVCSACGCAEAQWKYR